MEGRYHDYTLAEALEIARRNDPGDEVPSVSRTLIAEIETLRKDAERLRDRVERLRGLCKWASGKLLDAGDHKSAGKVLDLAGDAEGANAPN